MGVPQEPEHLVLRLLVRRHGYVLSYAALRDLRPTGVLTPHTIPHALHGPSPYAPRIHHPRTARTRTHIDQHYLLSQYLGFYAHDDHGLVPACPCLPLTRSLLALPTRSLFIPTTYAVIFARSRLTHPSLAPDSRHAYSFLYDWLWNWISRQKARSRVTARHRRVAGRDGHWAHAMHI